MTSALGTAALRLAGKGFKIFPLRPRSKEPFSDNKFFRTVGGYKCATRDPALIEFWWSRQPEANIGLATGSVSGVWVLDLDGEDDEAWLREQEIEPGENVPPTVEVTTSKGRHLYFKYPLGADIRNAQDRDDMPDVRANGGYVLLPPSIHPSGRVYAWSAESANAFPDSPAWLIEIVTNRGAGKSGEPIARSAEFWRSFIDEERDGSGRGSAIATLYGHLVRHNVDAFMALSLARVVDETRHKPPLGRGEVDRICDDIANLEADRREGKR
jgi:hypothetical protein